MNQPLWIALFVGIALMAVISYIQRDYLGRQFRSIFGLEEQYYTQDMSSYAIGETTYRTVPAPRLGAEPTPQQRIASSGHPSIPPERVTRLPAGWHCIKSLDLENMSTCFKTDEQCEFGREKFTASGLRYSGCLPQERASCFSFRSKLQGKESFDCSATIAGCERQRAHALSMTADVEDVRDCTSWGSAEARQAGSSDSIARNTSKWTGTEMFCSDMSAEGKTIERYICQLRSDDCDEAAASAETSAERAYRQQGRNVNVTMGRCKRSKERAFCAQLDDGYFCSSQREVCQAAIEYALRANKAKTVSSCTEWHPGRSF